MASKHPKDRPADSPPDVVARPLEPLLLQDYFDGELGADAQRAELAARLAAHPDDQRRLEALAEMSELVRFEHEQRIEDVDLSGLWGRIEARLDAEPAPTVAPRAARAASSRRGGWMGALRDFFGAQRAVLVPVFTAAAAAVLVLIPMLMNETPQPPHVINVVHHSSAVADAEPAVPAPGPGSNIVIVNAPPSEQANWLVTHSPETRTPVIWLTDDEPASPDSLEPGPGPAMGSVEVREGTEVWNAVQELLRQIQIQQAQGRLGTPRQDTPRDLGAPRDDAPGISIKDPI